MLQAGVQLLDSISVSIRVAVKQDKLIFPFGSADRDLTTNWSSVQLKMQATGELTQQMKNIYDLYRKPYRFFIQDF